MSPIITSQDVVTPEDCRVPQAGQREGAGLRRPVVQRGLEGAGVVRRLELRSGVRPMREMKSGEGRDAPPLNPVVVRNQIAARLMQLNCARKGGCTRRCRRLGRCAEAEAVEAEAQALLAADLERARGAKRVP